MDDHVIMAVGYAFCAGIVVGFLIREAQLVFTRKFSKHLRGSK